MDNINVGKMNECRSKEFYSHINEWIPFPFKLVSFMKLIGQHQLSKTIFSPAIAKFICTVW